MGYLKVLKQLIINEKDYVKVINNYESVTKSLLKIEYESNDFRSAVFQYLEIKPKTCIYEFRW